MHEQIDTMEVLPLVKDIGLLQRTKAELNKYDYVRFVFADISGVSRGKIVPIRHAKGFLEGGLATYAGKEDRFYRCTRPEFFNGGGGGGC